MCPYSGLFFKGRFLCCKFLVLFSFPSKELLKFNFLIFTGSCYLFLVIKGFSWNKGNWHILPPTVDLLLITVIWIHTCHI